MAERDLWEIVEPEFRWDGTLRDLHVPGTSTVHWDRLLAGVASWDWPHQYTIDGTPSSPPQSAQEALALAREATLLLMIQIGPVHFHCHFFGERDMEFNIDPREVADRSAFENVVSFMRQLGSAIQLPVFLTPEGGLNVPILSLNPASNDLRYHEPGAPVSGAV